MAIINGRNGSKANAKSVLSIVGADFKLNDKCRLLITGLDEKQAFEELTRFLKKDFAGSDEPLVEPYNVQGQIRIPPSLKLEGSKYYRGLSVVKGIGYAKAAILDALVFPNNLTSQSMFEKNIELSQIKKTFEFLKDKLNDKLSKSSMATEKKILESHLSIVRDPELSAKIYELVNKPGSNAASDIIGAMEYFTGILRATESMLLRERVLDIQDVCASLFEEIYGRDILYSEFVQDEPYICISQNLTPSRFLSLDKEYLKGLILTASGTTSHTVILARSYGVPTIVSTEQGYIDITAGQELILDANIGIVIAEPDEQIKRYYHLELIKLNRKQNRLYESLNVPAISSDGKKLEVGANISSEQEAHIAFSKGAEAIGLFRTEMLYMQNDAAPSEDEQFEIYRRIIYAAGKKPVIIRTLDVGGDKQLTYLNLEAETNPFLGYRAVRIYPQFVELITVQLRAIIRASAFGCVKLLIPMVCSIEEIRWVRQKMVDIQKQLDSQGIAFDKKMEIGIMVEVPSTIFIMDQLCDEADFFSIGTNDLAQYIFAADRENKRLGRLNDNLQPAFLRALKTIVDNAHSKGKWVGICGEMGGRTEVLPLLLGLGLDEISMACSGIPAIKAELKSISYKRCSALLESALKCRTADEVRQLLGRFRAEKSLAVIEKDLIITDSDCQTKHEAIKEAVDLLFATGRTDNPELIEEAVWNREAVYSTGFGYGFAVPHCKCDYVDANSICVLKFRNGIDWNSSDNEPVRVMILLVIRQSDTAGEHMQIFSKLARKIMHEDFREYMLEHNQPEIILDYLNKCLKINQTSEFLYH